MRDDDRQPHDGNGHELKPENDTQTEVIKILISLEFCNANRSPCCHINKLPSEYRVGL